MATKSLRAVSQGEQPPRRTPKTILDSADTGSSRDLLVAMRTRIAREMDDPDCPARDLASLSRRLLEIRRDIEALDALAAEEAAESAGATPDDTWEAV